MGEVFKPEDIYKKRVGIGDLSREIRVPSIGYDIQSLVVEIENLKREIKKIKRALEIHGIKVD